MRSSAGQTLGMGSWLRSNVRGVSSNNKTTRTTRLTYLSLLFAIVAFLIGGATAQTTKGSIAGVVTDPSGAVVQAATVTAVPVAGGESRSATTGEHGEYRIELLQPGEYTVNVKAGGFADLKAEHVVVRTSVVTSENLQLSVAKGTETVTVDASVQQVQTETGELSKTIDPVQVKEVPYVSLNPYALATTLPGVATVASRDDFTNGTSFSVNGLRPRANNFLIDGFDNNDNGIAGQAFQPNNIVSVQEVTVLTNSYTAEFGRGGGSVSNLTFKSGTNNLHGDAWEQYNASALDALGPDQVASGFTRVPQYVNNVFGFDLGGPVKKDKLFFYGTSQWNRNFGAQPTANQLVLPTAAGVATLQSLGPNSNVDLLLGAIGNLRGQPDATNPQVVNIGGRPGCAAPCPVEFGKFTRPDPGANLSREWTTRVDYNATPNDNLFVRYTDSFNSLSPDLFANPGALPSQDTQQSGPSRLLGSMWAHTFGPKVVNEFRFSAQQIDFTFGPLGATEANPNAHLPTISFSDSTNIFVGGFEQATFPQGRGHKTFQFQDAVSISQGNHTVKIGADLTLLLIRDIIPFNADGAYTVSKGGNCDGGGGTTITCTDLANFIDGFSGPSAQLTKSFGNPRINVPETMQAYYVQDSWKVKSNLTLDYGVRYEYSSPDFSNVLLYPTVNRSTLGPSTFLTRYEQKPDRNNFGPRFGFAYTPHFWEGLLGHDATVIRGGYGLYYDQFFTNISNNTASSSPNSLGGTLTPTAGQTRGIPDPIAAIGTITATANPFATRTSIDSNLVNPMTHQWNLNIQRELPAKLLMEVAYVGTRGERLWVNEQLNPRTPAEAGCCVNGPRVDPNLGSVVVRGNRGDSIYHGLDVSVSRNVGKLQLRGAYTWSRAIDNGSEVFVTSGGASRWQVVTDPRSDRGPSAFNRTHRASMTWAYELPSPGNRFLNSFLGGWISTGQVSFQSGAPETIYIGGWDQNGDGEAFNDRPSVGNLKAPINYSTSCLTPGSGCITGIGFDDGSGNLVDFNSGAPGTLNQFRYIVHDYGSGVNGNVGRNSIYYPGRQDWNLSVIKRFKMPFEGHYLEFRSDFFNAFNHPNDGIDSLNGQYGNINSTDFLNVAATRRGARHIALWLKYSF